MNKRGKYPSRYAAKRAKSAKERANIAIRIIFEQNSFGPAFDLCFKMGDEDAVYQEIIRRADRNTRLANAIHDKGLGYLLSDEYRKKYQKNYFSRYAGSRAKSAKERANIAIVMIMDQNRFGPAFDSCFKMGDEDAVYREIIRRADKNPKLANAMHNKGFGNWLGEKFRKRHEL